MTQYFILSKYFNDLSKTGQFLTNIIVKVNVWCLTPFSQISLKLEILQADYGSLHRKPAVAKIKIIILAKWATYFFPQSPHASAGGWSERRSTRLFSAKTDALPYLSLRETMTYR